MKVGPSRHRAVRIVEAAAHVAVEQCDGGTDIRADVLRSQARQSLRLSDGFQGGDAAWGQASTGRRKPGNRFNSAPGVVLLVTKRKNRDNVLSEARSELAADIKTVFVIERIAEFVV